MVNQWVSSNGRIDSFIEAAYLNSPVVTKGPERFIYVNPDHYRYLVGNIVVISDPTFNLDIIRWMLDNGIKVISRINFPEISDLIIEPYIPRIEFKVMWNGDVIDVSGKDLRYEDIIDTLTQSSEVEDTDTGEPMKVFLPKIKGIRNDFLFDSEKNLTGLGWGMYQVGINVRKDLKYQDLDLYKTKKVMLNIGQGGLL